MADATQEHSPVSLSIQQGKMGPLVSVRTKGGPGVLDSKTPPHLLDPHKQQTFT